MRGRDLVDVPCQRFDPCRRSDVVRPRFGACTAGALNPSLDMVERFFADAHLLFCSCSHSQACWPAGVIWPSSGCGLAGFHTSGCACSFKGSTQPPGPTRSRVMQQGKLPWSNVSATASR
eukprot:353534-Chlamydomonas_euryale.AAC.1